MAHVGLVCPNTPGHLNPMVALADAMRTLGHRVTFFLIADRPPAAVATAGFEVVLLGGAVYPAGEYHAEIRRLGTLEGRAAMKQTIAIGTRSTDAILTNGPALVRAAGVAALIVDQVSSSGGTVADELGMPFATVCNALLLNEEPGIPPFFTHWRPRATAWARLRNRVAWAGLNRLLAPVVRRIDGHRRRLGLSRHRRLADGWSRILQVSQQPETFEFPRRHLPDHFQFAGPLRLPGGYPPVAFPWERLDGRPLIYASLGTLQNRVADTFRMIAEACAALDAQLVLSTGNGIAPEALGELPGGAVAVAYAPQLELLRRSACTITHAGLNTALDALSCGVPMVALPVTNEQPGIAARIAWTGAGEALRLPDATPRILGDAARRVQSEPGYRAAAERIRDSIQASGGAARAAELIERSLGL